jgi:hypothetical protein
MKDEFFIEVECLQRNHFSERICGDVFKSGRVKEENRTVLVLSDGMGHGVKANVLATLTATMALKFTQEHKTVEKTAEIVMKTLPECSDRKMSYATFTVIDIDKYGKTTILEYDNPMAFVVRNGKEYTPEWKTVELEGDIAVNRDIRVCSFTPQKNDRIIFGSDGITQSGLGSRELPFGWGRDNLINYVLMHLEKNPEISARELSYKILNVANRNDGFNMKDDASAGTVYFREPRKLLICTGPPYHEEKDPEMAAAVQEFEGKKIIMGATTADVIARELDLEIDDETDLRDSDLPPVAHMQGVELITEGILTLAKVEEILKKYHPNIDLGHGPADEVLKLIRESDEIKIIIGTRVNVAHQDPNLPVELEIRRAVVKRIAKLLEEKLLKKVDVGYI